MDKTRRAMKQFLRARSLVLAFTVAGLLAAVAYWGTRSSCVESGTGLRGEEKVLDTRPTMTETRNASISDHGTGTEPPKSAQLRIA
jgi:hypothetical protein